VQTDRTIPNNKPDSMMRNNKIRNGCVATSAHRNVIEKEAEKIINYKDLIIEIQRV